MTTTIELILRAELRNTLMKLDRERVRLGMVQTMMRQFTLQCEAIPEGDPVRTVIESFIKAVDDCVNLGEHL